MALGCVLAMLPRGTSQRGAWRDLGLRAPQNALMSGSSSSGAVCDGHAAMPRSGESGFGAPVRAGHLSPPSPGGDMERWSPSFVWVEAAAGLLPPPISPACALGLFIGLPFISALFLPRMGKARGSDGEGSSLLCPTHRGRFCHQHCHPLPPPRVSPMPTSSGGSRSCPGPLPCPCCPQEGPEISPPSPRPLSNCCWCQWGTPLPGQVASELAPLSHAAVVLGAAGSRLGMSPRLVQLPRPARTQPVAVSPPLGMLLGGSAGI